MPDKYQALREAASRSTPGKRQYGVRRDGSIWLSIGDPVKGPHYQGDLVGTDADADLICAANPATIQALLAERDALRKALHGIACAFLTDTEMAAAEWSKSDIRAACSAYDAARAALSK